MHELAITESILNIATKHALQENANHVTDIYIVIGQLSSVVDDSVQFYWDMISQESICSNSKLHFERIPARLVCQDCRTNFTIEGELTFCPNCQSSKVKVISGDEFHLDSIEIIK